MRPAVIVQNLNRGLLYVVLNPFGIPVRLEIKAPVCRSIHDDLRQLGVTAITKEDPIGWDLNDGCAFEREPPERPFLSDREPEMGRAAPEPLEFLDRRSAIGFLFPHLDRAGGVRREGADAP